MNRQEEEIFMQELLNDPKIVDAATAWLEERQPDLVVISGDFTQRARVDQFRQAADYVDRVRAGIKPADLPVQAPTKFLLILNLKAAKALGRDVSPMLLARADEVIE